MVQVILGEVWKDCDLDIFCTPKAAPIVRAKLVQSGFTLSRLHDNYKDTASGMLRFLLETKVHHVEGWADTPGDGVEPKRLDGWSEDPRPFSFSESCQYGKKASRYFYGSLTHMLPFKVPHSTDQEIKATSAQPLSYNYQLTDRLELVIANSTCKDARELLESFDINICAAYYDGDRFHIPQPHKSFMKQSDLEPRRLQLMQAFAAAWRREQYPPNWDECDDVEDLPWFQAIKSTLGHAGIKGTDQINRDDALVGHAGMCYWNFFARLFQRQKKYSGRGIKLIGAPPLFKRLGSNMMVQHIPVAY